MPRLSPRYDAFIQCLDDLESDDFIEVAVHAGLFAFDIELFFIAVFQVGKVRDWCRLAMVKVRLSRTKLCDLNAISRLAELENAYLPDSLMRPKPPREVSII